MEQQTKGFSFRVWSSDGRVTDYSFQDRAQAETMRDVLGTNRCNVVSDMVEVAYTPPPKHRAVERFSFVVFFDSADRAPMVVMRDTFLAASTRWEFYEGQGRRCSEIKVQRYEV